MSKIRLGINGFGRIGRLVFRIAIKQKDIEIVAINDIIDAEYMVYLLKYDTVHGRFPGTVKLGKDKKSLVVNGIKIVCCQEKDPSKLPWGKLKVEYVAECTGFFRKKEDASKHLKAGAKKVLISAPTSDSPMFVFGVNHTDYKGEDIFSNASCTTNCLAPIAKILHEKWGIKEGLMTTIHAITSTQRTVDLAIRGGKKVWRRGRSANNIIPTSTGAALAVGVVCKALKGKLTGMCFRVPTLDVSVVDLTVKLVKGASKKEINEYLKKISTSKEWKGIFAFNEDECVSSDFIGDPHSCIYDSNASIFLNDTFMKLVCFYDNEYGYSNRIIDLILYTKSTGK